jgi:hypothetical protein
MEAIFSSGTSVEAQPTTRRHIPEDYTLQGVLFLKQWFPKWAVRPLGGRGIIQRALRGKGAAGDAGGGPLRARFSFIYD